MSYPTFDAWAVPADVAVGDTFVEREAGGLRLRCVDVDAEWVASLVGGLLRSRDALLARPTRALAELLGRVGARFLDPDDDLRREALELLPATAGLSPQMAHAVLDGMATDWTAPRLLRLLEEEFGERSPLDGFQAVATGARRAVGPSLCVQVVAGSVPGVGTTALVRSLLAKGPTLLKAGLGDVVLPVLFARALAEADAEVARSVAVVYWRGGSRALEEVAVERADVVVAYGNDEAVRAVRDRTPVTARFVAYHHRVGVGVVAREVLTAAALGKIAAQVARACALFDRRGCVSPQTVFAEEGGERSAADFAAALAEALSSVEETLPSGRLASGEAAGLHQLRGTAELLAATDTGVRVHHGGVAPWTVIHDPGGKVPPGGAGRTVRVVPVADVHEVPGRLAPLGRHLQSVALAGGGDRRGALDEALVRAGATRLTDFDSMPFPPPWWRHDGSGPITALVRWAEVEG